MLAWVDHSASSACPVAQLSSRAPSHFGRHGTHVTTMCTATSRLRHNQPILPPTRPCIDFGHSTIAHAASFCKNETNEDFWGFEHITRTRADFKASRGRPRELPDETLPDETFHA